MISVASWRDSGAWFTHQGHRIYYRDEGTGHPLLLIHGFPTSSWDWQALWPSLVGQYRCITLDMLGFGFSDKPLNHRYSLFEQADLCEALLLERGINQVHVLAHDYGDTVLQELLARQLEGKQRVSITTAFMLNGGIIPGQHRPRLMQRLLLSPLGKYIGPLMTEVRFQKSFREIFGRDSQPTLEELQAWWHLLSHNEGRKVLHLLIRYMHERRQHYDRWVGAITNSPIPLRYLVGSDDPISGKHMAECFGSLGPHQNWRLLPGIGHYPQTEAPALVLEDYTLFRNPSHQ